ncbi:MAG TPA: condensation domain-containing protein [Thermoanaerobaculia bacterium]|jgi:malonyl CoA-acyl carrier protein transacylase/aryl carrier-like protein|nr:condensation domain-containing protein [Thermoanaerobaculia bacterium]
MDGVRGGDAAYREFAYQPALVAVQIALARLVEHFGVITTAFCGNSLGEYAAAYIAGTFDRRALMAVTSVRDTLMRSAPEGRMLAAQASARDVTPLLLDDIDLAGETWDDRILLSGPTRAVHLQHEILEQRGVFARVLPGRVAPHGRLMRRIAAEFRRAFDDVHLADSGRPIVSTLAGDWATSEQLADPEHWVRHLCEPFRFRQAFAALVASGCDRFVEASPGAALTKLVRTSGTVVTCTTLGGEPDADPETAFLAALGDLWCSGSEIAWDLVNGSTEARFTPLPPYPFQRRRFWNHRARHGTERFDASDQRGLLERPIWRPRPIVGSRIEHTLPRHVAVNGGGAIATSLIDRLTQYGVRVVPADEAGATETAPDTVLVDVSQAGPLAAAAPTNSRTLSAWLDSNLLTPLGPLRRLRPARLLLAVRGLWPVVSDDRPAPERSGIIGIARCAPHDWPGLLARIIDLSPHAEPENSVDAIVAELASDEIDDVAYRNHVRYRRTYESVAGGVTSRLRPGGTYVVLGGTGRLGAVVAEAISQEVGATVVLTGRRPECPMSAETDRLIAAAIARGCDVVRRAVRSDDRAQLRDLLDEVGTRAGRIDGLFHLAANTEIASFEPLDDLSLASAAAIAQAKVCTAALLAEELSHREYDFVAFFSSISTVIGARRFAAYVAANAYLDALAEVMTTKTGRRWYSLVWDGWAPDGAAAPNALGFADGAALLLRALRTDSTIVAPVVQPLEQRLATVRGDLATVARDGLDIPVAPGLSVAGRVLKVITDITGHVEIDPQRKFASLGIDSLRLMQIAARLHVMLGRKVGIGALLAATSVEQLINLATAENAAHVPRPTPSVDDGALSTPQLRLWYLTQLHPRASDYNVPFGWQVRSTIGAVREAVLAMLEQHEMLRSTYQQDEESRPFRVAIRPRDVPFTEVDLDPADPDRCFDRIVRAFVEVPFDLASGSCRVLLASGAGLVRLVFVCHHLSIDAWSIKLLREELSRRLSTDHSAIVTAPARYVAFVRWEHEMREGPEHERLAQYWRETLRDARPTRPPADEVTATSGGRPVGRASAVLPRGQLDALRSILRDEGATLYAAALTGLSIAVSKWCGEQEIVIGTNLANRLREEFESVVGMFVDPVVLRLTPGHDAPNATLGTALAHVRSCFSTALAHSGIPYLDVVRLSGRHGAQGDNPLFSIMATMFDAESGDEQVAPLDVPLPTASKFALAVEFLPKADGLWINALYAADQYLQGTIDLLLERTLRYLARLADNGAHVPALSLFDKRPTAPIRERFAERLNRLRIAPAHSPE